MNPATLLWTLFLVTLNMFFSKTGDFTSIINRNAFVANFMTNIFALIQNCDYMCHFKDKRDKPRATLSWTVLIKTLSIIFSKSNLFARG